MSKPILELILDDNYDKIINKSLKNKVINLVLGIDEIGLFIEENDLSILYLKKFTKVAELISDSRLVSDDVINDYLEKVYWFNTYGFNSVNTVSDNDYIIKSHFAYHAGTIAIKLYKLTRNVLWLERSIKSLENSLRIELNNKNEKLISAIYNRLGTNYYLLSKNESDKQRNELLSLASILFKELEAFYRLKNNDFNEAGLLLNQSSRNYYWLSKLTSNEEYYQLSFINFYLASILSDESLKFMFDIDRKYDYDLSVKYYLINQLKLKLTGNEAIHYFNSYSIAYSLSTHGINSKVWLERAFNNLLLLTTITNDNFISNYKELIFLAEKLREYDNIKWSKISYALAINFEKNVSDLNNKEYGLIKAGYAASNLYKLTGNNKWLEREYDLFNKLRNLKKH